MVQANGTTLAAITNAFNSSQNKVHVTLVDPGQLRRHLAEVRGGPVQRPAARRRPARGQRTQAAIDTQSFLPVQSCMNAAKYSTADYLARPSTTGRSTGSNGRCPSPSRRRSSSTTRTPSPRRASTRRPADHPAPDGGRRQDTQGLGQRHGPRARPLASRDLAGHGQHALRQQRQRTQRAAPPRSSSTTRPAVSIFSELSQLVRSGDATTNPSSGPTSTTTCSGSAAASTA